MASVPAGRVVVRRRSMSMTLLRWSVRACSMGALLAVPTVVLAQSAAAGKDQSPSTGGAAPAYPYKPVRMVTTESGGASDIAARVIAQAVSLRLGQQIVVDNRGGIIAIETAARAAPDGYTLLFYGGTLWLLPLMRDKVTWDAIRDFAPITLAVSSPLLLVTNPSLAVQSVKDLIALAKSKPGVLNYGSPGSGAATHLASELFKAMAGVDIVRVVYKGSGPALNSLAAGEVQLMFPTASSAAAFVKAGRLKGLAVTSAFPSTLLPEFPTVAASGLPGYEYVSILGVFAPAATPAGVIRRVHQEIVSALGQPELKDKFLRMGVEVRGTSPQELASVIKAEIIRVGKVIRDVGIRAE